MDKALTCVYDVYVHVNTPNSRDFICSKVTLLLDNMTEEEENYTKLVFSNQNIIYAGPDTYWSMSCRPFLVNLKFGTLLRDYYTDSVKTHVDFSKKEFEKLIEQMNYQVYDLKSELKVNVYYLNK